VKSSTISHEETACCGRHDFSERRDTILKRHRKRDLESNLLKLAAEFWMADRKTSDLRSQRAWRSALHPGLFTERAELGLPKPLAASILR
jgi:hypothetical protein